MRPCDGGLHPRWRARRRAAGVTALSLSTLGLSLVTTSPAGAQDAQWWTNQYGNRARLLGGAVIGSSRDLSAVYYNPGGLAVVEQAEALLTAYVFELDNINYTDLTFQGTDLSSTRFDAVAGLIAGELPFNFLGSTRLAYSYLTRHNLEYRFNAGGTAPGDEVRGFESAADVAASLSYETRLREYWGGLTWATPVLEKYGLGISLFVANRSQRLRYGTGFTATSDTVGILTANSQRSYDYYDWRLLGKIGLSTSYDRWNLGLTVTTPSIRLFGNGNLRYETVGIGPGLESVTATFQDGLPSGYASSWAIGAGGEYVGSNWKGHLAVEWFDRVDVTVLDGEPFRSLTDSTTVVDPDVNNRMKSLVNVAIGAERAFSDKVSGFASFYTDFTGSEPGDDSITTTTPWNLWTLGAGAIFSVGRSEFTTGLTYKFGGRDDLGAFDLIPDDDRDDSILSDSASGSFWRLTLVLGFKLQFAPDL